MLDIYVDADACPVKQETCRVAQRCGLRVFFVANSRMRIPAQDGAKLVVVDDHLDAADDWIVDHIESDDIVVTADVPLASRCVGTARVLSPSGHLFTEANIGPALATRDLLADLRGAGEMLGGPPPFQKRDRSRFLQGLDSIIQDVRRSHRTDR